tara:strand:- start:677 stop:1720 length:1044 start_codon:yes stop_codon:yes gene_type:complete
MNRYLKESSNKIFNNLGKTLDELKDKTILITGANGLIGGFLSDFFVYLNDEHDFNCKLVLTSLSSKPERLEHLIFRSDVTYYSLDLTSDAWFFDEIDFCIYCAGYAQPNKFLSNTEKTYQLNVDSMVKTFQSVFHNRKNAKMLFISSSEVYALNNTSKPHCETDELKLDLWHKRAPYIIGKVTGEYNVGLLRRKGYGVKSARVSLCYGPGHVMGDTRVMSELTVKGIENETINLFDDGSSFRKYQHISDCCIMLINILLKGKEEVYNVGGREETTIYDMAKIIGDKFNKKVVKGKINNDIASSAPKKVSISLDRYLKEFDDLDFTSFENGMENYLSWYKKKYDMSKI